jgi:membrane associated rhomboid family serine protease
MVPAAVGFHCPECLAEGRKSTRAVRTIYGGKVRPGETPGVVSRILIALNVIVFIITCASGAKVLSGTGNSPLYDRFALIPPAVADGEWWRLFTSAFLHFGIVHIGFNMLALWWAGPALEAAMGKVRFLALYVLAGVGGGILSTALGPLNATAAGASGAIFGLFGALYVVSRHRNINTQAIGFTIIANLVLSFSVSNIDWRGHVGGLIVGTAIAAIIAYAPRPPLRDRYQVVGIVAVSGLLVLAGFGAVSHVEHRCQAQYDTLRGIFATSGASGLNQDNAGGVASCIAHDPGSIKDR